MTWPWPCKYCGSKCQPYRFACAGHRDLLKLDPYYTVARETDRG